MNNLIGDATLRRLETLANAQNVSVDEMLNSWMDASDSQNVLETVPSEADSGAIGKLIATVPLPLLVINRETEIIYGSQPAHELFGYDTLVNGFRLESLILESLRSKFMEYVQHFLNHSLNHALTEPQQFVVRHKNGHTFSLEVILAAYETSSDVVIFVLAQAASNHNHVKVGTAQNDAFTESLLDNTDLSVIVLDPEYKIRAVNRVSNALIERLYKAKIKIGDDIRDLLAGRDRDRKAFSALFERALAGETVDQEIALQTAGADTIWVVNRYYPIQVSDGSIIGICLVTEDITLASLQSSEERFRRLALHAPVGISRMSVDGTVTFVNEAWSRITGIEPQIAHTWRDYVHADDKEILKSQTYSAQSQGEAQQSEYRLIRSDDREIWIQQHTVPVYDKDGNVLEYLNTITDISSQKNAERTTIEFQNNLKALQEVSIALANMPDADDVYRATVQLARVILGFDRFVLYLRDEDILRGTYGTTSDGKVRDESDLYWQLDAQPWVGIIDSLPNRVYLWERVALSDDNHKLSNGWRAISAVWTGDQTIGYILTDNLTSQRPPRTYEIELLSLFGATIGHVIQHKRNEVQIHEAREAAESANKAKSAFLANMSHELRTPLNAILGFAQLLDGDDALAETHRRQVKIITRSGEHLLDLINDVLDFSRIEAGQTSLSLKSFNLHRLIADVHAMLNMRAKDKGLTFSHEIPSSLPQYIGADEGKLRQILINILGNSIKFTSHGGATLRMSFDDDFIYFEVEDTGKGIERDVLATIFEPFVRVEESSKSTEGSGLGLAISRQYVEMMGGSIRAESTVGKGTTIYFKVRYTLADHEKSTTQEEQRRVVGLHGDEDSRRILVVDDREESRILLQQMLSLAGFEVFEASDGYEAIEMTQSYAPHLIFMDMRMPHMDGYEATRRIRELELSESPSIVAFTASAFKHQREQVLGVGCNELITKPFRADEVFSVIQQQLKVRYVYEEQEATADSTHPAALGRLEDLRYVEPEIRESLMQSVLLLDQEKTRSIIEQIARNDEALARELSRSVAAYEYNKIFDVLEAINGDS